MRRARGGRPQQGRAAPSGALDAAREPSVVTPGEDLLVGVDGGGDQGQEDGEGGQADESGQTREGAGFAADDPPDLVGAGEDGQTHDVGGEARGGFRAPRGEGAGPAPARARNPPGVPAGPRGRPRPPTRGGGGAAP